MSLKIFRDRYVLLLRAGISFNIFHRSARAQATIVVPGTTGEGLLWPLFAWSSWAQPVTVEADTTGEGAALTTVNSVGVD
jgi:hypothetical protein